MSPAPLTEAEAAAAKALALHFNRHYSDGIERHKAVDWESEARAALAVARPLIEAEVRKSAGDVLAGLAPKQPTPDAKDAFWRAAIITSSKPRRTPEES